MSFRKLLIDFNSYFASVEQHLQPELQGRPVGVVPAMTDSTCCIAVSYEAKAFGVKTGTNVGEAKKLCPEIILVEARHRTYVEWHQHLLDVIESCIHIDQVLSIDEVACTLPENWQTRHQAEALARKIKQRIHEKAAAIQCSIGFGPNTFLAKIASNMEKPDGLTFIDVDSLPECLYSLKLSDIHGVGRKMEQRIRMFGIQNVEELCGARKEQLRKIWGGVGGEQMFDQLRGKDIYQAPIKNRTLGHSHVLAPNERDPLMARAVLHRLTQKAAVRLRHGSYFTGRIHISLKYLDQTRWRQDMQILETQDTLELIRCLNRLWQRRPHPRKKLLAVGVTLLDLVTPDNRTLRLFDRSDKNVALNRAMDQINSQFGNQKIYFGGAHEAQRSAPMRIAFTHIPDLETEDDSMSS
ncbi:MAG: DNA polymerase [Bacteroidota bacterium]